jgi:hypothetical protein
MHTLHLIALWFVVVAVGVSFLLLAWSAWVWNRRDEPRPGPLPDEVFWGIVEREWPEHRTARTP